MIPVTYNGAPAFLLDDLPDWSTAVALDASLPASYERGLTGRETRRPTGDTLRLELKWSAVVTGAALTTLRNSLQALNTQPVLCPFWPAAFAPGSTPPATAASYATFDGGTFSAVVPAADIDSQSPALTAYPLLVGILAEIPDPQLLAAPLARVDFKFTENANPSLALPPFTPPSGIAAAGGARPLFPFAPDWNTPPKSGGAEVDLTRQPLGAGRELAQAYYDQRPRRRLEQTFTLLDAQPLNLLSFLLAMGGGQNSFWLPAALMETRLTADALASDTALQVDNPAGLGINSFVLLESGATRLPLAVSGITSNFWNLAGAVGTAFAAAPTQVESLVLARFDAPKLSLTFTSPNLATATLRFKELPWETAAVAGETVGATMGALPVTAMLYVFTLATPGAPAVYRFTNFERDLACGGDTYAHVHIENDDLTELPSLERQNITIKTRSFPGNPLALLVPFQLEWPLQVQLYEADVTGSTAGNLRCHFSGEVSEARADGPFIDATCASLSWMFDRAAARRLYQDNDNWVLFEPANGLSPADWEWHAVVAAYDAATATLVVGSLSSSNSATLAAHYFAAGYVKITTGGRDQCRMVGDSLPPAAGQLTLALTAPLFTAPHAGDAVALYAGYDGQFSTALTKFAGSGIHYGGFPFMPAGNPFVLKISPNAGTGKK
jgi:Phage conserved hypothetical protein BR0599